MREREYLMTERESDVVVVAVSATVCGQNHNVALADLSNN